MNSSSLNCRICLEKVNTQDGTNIFTSFVNEDLLSSLFDILFNIEVHPDDDFPQMVCLKCKLGMELAINLRKQAIESNETFLNMPRSQILSREKENFQIIEQEDEFEEGELLEDIQDDDFSENDETDAVEFLLKNIPKADEKQKINKNYNNEKNERKFQCNVCQKKFIKKTNLTDHLKLHAGVKNFKCQICGKAFTQYGNLNAHMRSHTKEKPFVCNICDKRYTQSSALKTHMRTHTNDRSYICDICGKGFTNASDLGKHKKIHLTEKEYLCKKCDLQFTQKVHVIRHVRKVHPYENLDDLWIKRRVDPEPKIEKK